MKMKHQKLQTYVRRTALVMMTAVMCLTSAVSTQAAKISNPRIVKDSSMQAGQKVTYDCVYFGSYPQAEVIGSKSAATTIAKEIRNGQDYIVDADLYAKLKKAKKWDKNGDIVIGGSKYRRVKAADATFNCKAYYGEYDDNYYKWNDNYHYFKYQPIKWRVLYKTKDEMFLLADQALDCQKYNTEYTSVTWATSTIRSWLNGYGSGSNAQGISYKSKGFADIAFSKKQYNTILKGKVKNSNNLVYDTPGGADTRDKIFLLAENQVCTDSAKKYGFVSGYYDMYDWDEARRSKSSSYAKAMGCMSVYDESCCWWLRSPGPRTNYASFAVLVNSSGCVYYDGSLVGDSKRGVRPALKIDLSSSAQYKYAGTVCTDGRVKKAK